MEVPEAGAVFTLGKSYLSENHQSYFFIKNDAVKKLITGNSQSAVICESGRLFVWGENHYGELGVGTTSNITRPSCVKEIKNLGKKVKDVTFGYGFSVILTEDNKIYFCGKNLIHPNNEYEQLDYSKPHELKEFQNIKNENNVNFNKLSAGASHFIVLSDTGKAYGYGNNKNNQISDENKDIFECPIKINIDGEIRISECGQECSAFITENNNIYITGMIRYIKIPKITQITQTFIKDEISSLHITKTDNIYLIVNQIVLKSVSFYKIEDLYFEKFIPRDRSDRIQQISFGKEFISFVTDDGKFYSTIKEKEKFFNDKRFKELQKFDNMYISSIASGLHHILVHAFPKSLETIIEDSVPLEIIKVKESYNDEIKDPNKTYVIDKTTKIYALSEAKEINEIPSDFYIRKTNCEDVSEFDVEIDSDQLLDANKNILLPEIDKLSINSDLDLKDFDKFSAKLKRENFKSSIQNLNAKNNEPDTISVKSNRENVNLIDNNLDEKNIGLKHLDFNSINNNLEASYLEPIKINMQTRNEILEVKNPDIDKISIGSNQEMAIPINKDIGVKNTKPEELSIKANREDAISIKIDHGKIDTNPNQEILKITNNNLDVQKVAVDLTSIKINGENVKLNQNLDIKNNSDIISATNGEGVNSNEHNKTSIKSNQEIFNSREKKIELDKITIRPNGDNVKNSDIVVSQGLNREIAIPNYKSLELKNIKSEKLSISSTNNLILKTNNSDKISVKSNQESLKNNLDVKNNELDQISINSEKLIPINSKLDSYNSHSDKISIDTNLDNSIMNVEVINIESDITSIKPSAGILNFSKNLDIQNTDSNKISDQSNPEISNLTNKHLVVKSTDFDKISITPIKENIQLTSNINDAKETDSDKTTDSDSSLLSTCTVKSVSIEGGSKVDINSGMKLVRRDSLKYIDRAMSLVKIEGIARKISGKKNNEESGQTTESNVSKSRVRLQLDADTKSNKENIDVLKIIDVSKGEEYKCISMDGQLQKVELITSSSEDDRPYTPNEIRYINNGVDVTEEVVKKGDDIKRKKKDKQYLRGSRVAPEVPILFEDQFLGERLSMMQVKQIRDMKDETQRQLREAVEEPIKPVDARKKIKTPMPAKRRYFSDNPFEDSDDDRRTTASLVSDQTGNPFDSDQDDDKTQVIEIKTIKKEENKIEVERKDGKVKKFFKELKESSCKHVDNIKNGECFPDCCLMPVPVSTQKSNKTNQNPQSKVCSIL